ncbi:MAG: Glutathione-regulated potassium-efflux system protein KefB [Myxococcota bacterium]|nr:Glutathione-regulated potassium-efflux system protein KefB [Myxococcota bacterium]
MSPEILRIPLIAVAGGAPSDGGLGLVPAIGVAVIAAATLAVLFNFIKQPALLAYIVAGLILGFSAKSIFGGSVAAMETVSHLGLVFLLFIIGMEMDIRGIFSLGTRAGAAVLLQTPVTIALMMGLHWAVSQMGWAPSGFASSKAGWFYFSTAVALSSTAVAVKLLADKFDLTSQAGRISVLTLIGQDIWAVLALSYVSTGASSESGGGPSPFVMIGGALVLAVLFSWMAKVVLARIMASLARSPDLITLTALGWCFLCAQSISAVGLSAEMGALIAGITLGALPTSSEVLAKVLSLRDFFMALFFVALGMSLPPPAAEVILDSLALAAIVILSRLLLFAPMLMAARLGPIVSFTAPINLAQLSEFSLLLVPIGLTAGALTPDEASTISYAMMLSVLLSTYAIKYNYNLAIWFERVLGLSGKRRSEAQPDVHAERGGGGGNHGHGAPPEVVLLGFYLNADALMIHLKKELPELLPRILVIDFNVKNHPKIRAYGVQVAYGDISNPETLRHLGLGSARVVMSTISNTFLRGTSNERLIQDVRSINPTAKFISTAVTAEETARHMEKGVYESVCPPALAAPGYLQALTRALNTQKHPDS